MCSSSERCEESWHRMSQDVAGDLVSIFEGLLRSWIMKYKSGVL